MWEGQGLRVFLLCLGGALLCSFATEASSAPREREHSHRRRLSLHRHRERGKEGQVLHRSKRGWVWNQFFVIEEYTGPDPVLVGRVRTCFVCHYVWLSETVFDTCNAIPIKGLELKTGKLIVD